MCHYLASTTHQLEPMLLHKYTLNYEMMKKNYGAARGDRKMSDMIILCPPLGLISEILANQPPYVAVDSS